MNNTLSWSYHIRNTAGRTSKTLNFLRCNYKCSEEVKASAYISLVCPLMEYASIVWDPCQVTTSRVWKREYLTTLIIIQQWRKVVNLGGDKLAGKKIFYGKKLNPLKVS